MLNPLRSALARRPFVPFRIVLDETAGYDIRHPEQVLLARDAAQVTVTVTTDVEARRRTVALIVALAHISKLLPLGPRPPA